MTRRVVVTGVGLISSVGVGTEANWEALCAGRSGIGPITHFDASDFSARIAGEVKGFDPLQFFDRKDVKKMDVFIQYAMAASEFAVSDAGLEITPENADQIGVFIASGIGGFSTIEREHLALVNGGPRRISPFFIPASIINLAAGQVSIRFGARGPNLADVHGLHRIGALDRRVLRDHQARRCGRHDRRRFGGVDHADGRRRICGHAGAVDAQRRARTRASRPFDKDRDGFIVGEGAGIVVLEELEFARRRGATIYAEIAGYGLSGDAFHLTAQPEDANGAVRSMRMALKKAGVRPDEIDYINAHGTSTPINDPTETLRRQDGLR